MAAPGQPSTRAVQALDDLPQMTGAMCAGVLVLGPLDRDGAGGSWPWRLLN